MAQDKKKPTRGKTSKRKPTKGQPVNLINGPEGHTPEPDAGALRPFPKETKQDHRAFLLWGMQHPNRRSKRLAGQAVGMGETTIRRRYTKFKWADRLREIGGEFTSDIIAWRVYLELYVDEYGMDGVATVQKNMKLSGPETPLGMIKERLGDKAIPRNHKKGSLSRELLEEAGDVATSEAVREPGKSHAGETVSFDTVDDIEARRKVWREVVSKSLNLYLVQINAATAPDASEEAKAAIKIRPADLETLIALEQEIHGVSDQQNSGPKESVRVRLARASGANILEAIEADHQEIAFIVQALRNKEAQALEDEAKMRAEAIAEGKIIEFSG